MRKPPIPIDETARIESLKKLAILDTLPEERFDRVTRLVAKSFDVPVVAISFVDTDRQWFKSKLGLKVNETPRDFSFCAHGIADLEAGNSKYRIFEVSDAQKDERFADNPLVVRPPYIRSYAGFILQTEDQYSIGALCLIDNKPRSFSDEEKQALADYGMIVQNMLHSLQYEQHIVERLQKKGQITGDEAGKLNGALKSRIKRLSDSPPKIVQTDSTED